MATPSATVTAPIAYLDAVGDRAEHLVYPPASGRPSVRPPQVHHRMTIADCRALAKTPRDYGWCLRGSRRSAQLVDVV